MKDNARKFAAPKMLENANMLNNITRKKYANMSKNAVKLKSVNLGRDAIPATFPTRN
jgi:hypothetical protein